MRRCDIIDFLGLCKNVKEKPLNLYFYVFVSHDIV